MQHHLAPVAGKEQCQARHRVGMVYVDDVILPAPFPQGENHGGRDHRGGHLHPGAAANETGVGVDGYGTRAALRQGAQHVAVHATLRKARHQVVHHFLHTAAHRVEFTELEDFQNFHLLRLL
jgi:hypothetical protein